MTNYTPLPAEIPSDEENFPGLIMNSRVLFGYLEETNGQLMVFPHGSDKNYNNTK